MYDVIITPKRLQGTVDLPSSKSMCRREIISSALSDGISEISNFNISEDILITINAARVLGAEIEIKDDKLIIDGRRTFANSSSKNINIECSNSSSILRFLIPIALFNYKSAKFTGNNKVNAEHLDTYLNIFNEFGIKYIIDDNKLPITLYSGRLGETIQIKGNVHSQFISGLLYALPLLDYDTVIELSTPLQSKASIDLTIQSLENHGINIINNKYKHFTIRGNQKFKPNNTNLESDANHLAYFLAAGAVGNFIVCKNYFSNNINDMFKIIKNLNSDIIIEDNCIAALPNYTRGTTIDITKCPQLVPAIAVIAALSRGETTIKGISKTKHSGYDRFSIISQQLNALGATIIEKNDSLVIEGAKELSGGIADSCGDHRIAMALAIASTKCKNEVRIKNCSVTDKSYPGFWDALRQLGAEFKFE